MQVLLENSSGRAGSRYSRRQILGWAGALCGVRSLARAQEDATFSTDVRVVNVLATVRDHQGFPMDRVPFRSYYSGRKESHDLGAAHAASLRAE